VRAETDREREPTVSRETFPSQQHPLPPTLLPRDRTLSRTKRRDALFARRMIYARLPEPYLSPYLYRCVATREDDYYLHAISASLFHGRGGNAATRFRRPKPWGFMMTHHAEDYSRNFRNARSLASIRPRANEDAATKRRSRAMIRRFISEEEDADIYDGLARIPEEGYRAARELRDESLYSAVTNATRR